MMTEGTERRARIAVIGTGWWATYAHLPSLKDYPAAEIAAIADPNPEALNRAGDAFGVAKRYADYREMLEKERPDGVVVPTPHATHYEIVKEALGRGVGVMVEKPMVLHARQARELVALADERGVPLVVGYTNHFHALHQKVREVIASGRLGQIQLVHSLMSSMVLEYYRGNPAAYAGVFDWKVTGPGAATYSDPSVAGGGQGQTQVTHSAALLLWLTGLRPVEIAAQMANFDVDVDLCDAISVRFDGGAVGTIASTGGISAAQGGNGQMEYRIYGDEGFLLLDSAGGKAALHLNDGAVEEFAEGEMPLDPKLATARHLVDLLLGTATENQASGEIGARVVELLEASYRSAAERRFVTVDEL